MAQEKRQVQNYATVSTSSSIEFFFLFLTVTVLSAYCNERSFFLSLLGKARTNEMIIRVRVEIIIKSKVSNQMFSIQAIAKTRVKGLVVQTSAIYGPKTQG